MRLNKLVCPKCHSQDFSGFAKGDHIGIRCRECGAHVKWAGKPERALLEEYGMIELCEDPRVTLGNHEISVTDKLDLIFDRLESVEQKLDGYLDFGDPEPKGG